MTDFTAPVVARGVDRARHVLASAPPEGDEYGFTYQTGAAGVHGSHRAEAPTMKAIESRAEVDSLDALQQTRRELVQRVAPLRALYGPGGTWDARRKAHRSAIANAIAVASEKAPSEAALERLAAAHPDVVALLDKVDGELVTYHLLENDLRDVNEQIESRKALIWWAGQEARLT